MMKHIKSIVALVSIVAVMGLLLAVTNSITAPIIAKNEAAAANEALLVVMPEGEGFESVDLSGYGSLGSVIEAYKETSGKGYVLKLETSGYGNGLILMCGVSAEGTITGATCIASNETNGAEKTYGDAFVGKDLTGAEAVDVVAGSTITSKAYRGAMVDAIKAATILGGGSADLRTPEQILQDNLKAALPAGDTFTKWFATEIIEGVDAIYVADNGAGYVALAVAEEIGENFTGEFIGIDADLNIIAAGSTANTEAAYKAVKAVQASVLTEVDTEGTGINENIQSVQKTASGNYVIEINGLGYAWFDDNHGYGEQRFVPIVIRVSLTAEGKIIDCLTVSHEESAGIGDICGQEDYYSQFDGKTAETYTEVEAIAGATYTTNGYMKAIERCFEAVTILEGGAQ